MVYSKNDSTIVAEDYLTNTPINHVIPSYASIDEMMYFVVEATEEDFNNMMQETGIRELQHFEETGTEYIYEGGKLKSFKDSAVKTFEKMWGTVKDMIQKALDTINQKSHEFREKIFKKIDQKMIKDKANTVKADKVFVSSYSFPGVADKGDKYLSTLESTEKEIHSIYTTALASYQSDGKSAAAVDELDAKINDKVKQASKSISGYASEELSTVAKNIKANLRGSAKDWKGSDVKANYSTILKEVIDFPDTKKGLQKGYNKLKKGYNTTIGQIKKDCDAKGFEPSIFSKAIKGYKSIKHLSTTVEQAVISVLNEQYNTYREIIIKLIGSRSPKAVGESSTIDTVDSLFNW